MSKIRIVFDGPPGPEGGRFVEVENEHGKSISVGTWESSQAFTGPKYWHLVLDDPTEIAALRARVDDIEVLLAKAREVIQWMSGSADFGKAGIAGIGWATHGRVVLAELTAALRRDGETP